jgi:hypothetical protein
MPPVPFALPHLRGCLPPQQRPGATGAVRGRDDRGRLLAGGLYLLHLRTLDAAGTPRSAQVLSLALVRR